MTIQEVEGNHLQGLGHDVQAACSLLGVAISKPESRPVMQHHMVLRVTDAVNHPCHCCHTTN